MKQSAKYDKLELVFLVCISLVWYNNFICKKGDKQMNFYVIGTLIRKMRLKRKLRKRTGKRRMSVPAA